MSGPTAFQRRTARLVDKRLWDPKRPRPRFLIADEVGLGKTIVAREIISRTIGRFPGQRIDIVYLCSSQAIASQNLKRLKVGGHGNTATSTRLTLLATHVQGTEGVRYVALTPDTSFSVKGRSGHVRERALIWRCLKGRMRFDGFREMLQLVGEKSWEDQLWRLEKNPPNPEIVRAFRDAVSADPELRTEIRDVARAAKKASAGDDPRFRRRRNNVIGKLREELAACSIDQLAKVGLVIVDEFQRFSHLLKAVTASSSLAERLADRLLTDAHPRRRVLLLSATPYRVPGATLAAGESPYDDFVELVRYLAGEKQAAQLEKALARFSAALRSRPPDETAVVEARDAAQRILRQVMSRTERTGFTRDADGMVAEDVRRLKTQPDDLVGAVAGRKIARRLRARDPVEYWKSAPYFLDFMRDYQFKGAAVSSSGRDRSFVTSAARQGALLLDPKAVRQFGKLALPSPRLRDLVEQAIPEGVERLLWVAPSLPYMQTAGIHARAAVDPKRLIFTEWRLAPDAVSALISFEIERRLEADHRALLARRRATKRPARGRGIGSASGTANRHGRFALLGDNLRLGRSGGEDDDPTLGLAPLALMLPGRALADIGDPLALALENGASVAKGQALSKVQAAIGKALRRLGRFSRSGRVDDRWYWAAPLLLDRREDVDSWLEQGKPFSIGDAGTLDVSRLQEAIESILDEPEQLGRKPKDLLPVLARMALAAPGIAAYRSLRRTLDGAGEEGTARQCAFHIARGFQLLFNQNEAAAAVQVEYPRIGVYWKQALEYCIDGNLQALLDEQFHLESDALDLFEGTSVEKLRAAAISVHEAMTLRRASIEIRGLERRRRRRKDDSEIESLRLRCRHALRFAEIKDADGQVSRLDAVREAFNSPFRPFLLASTAVGQEGLDFHPWCHAVVHWNLPKSPVEFEQREGRVHRYKGHAVRLNIAKAVGFQGLANADFDPASDPWRAMFDRASDASSSDLAPYWIFEECVDPVRVKRIVPILKWSREDEFWPKLQNRLATYRLVMGLPRQDDLLIALEYNGITREQARRWRIDLSPS